MAYVRAQDLIAVGCASTALAATVYDDFMTTHSLFGIPVLEEDDYDTIQHIPIEVTPERRTLLQSASLIVWDEAFSNHSSCLTIVLKNFFNNFTDNNSTPKILLLVGDNKQIAPVVKYGSKQQIIEASIVSHPSFPDFRVHRFTKNLRLLCSDISDINYFQNYTKMLIEIGTGNADTASVPISEVNESTSAQEVHIPCISATADIHTALRFLHPTGDILDPAFYTRCLLAGKLKCTRLIPLHIIYYE